MLHRFHDRFGTAGVIIAVIALIAALGGTALAAGGLNPTQKKEVKKIAQKYAGKPGATGPAGTNGAKGDQGIQGIQGIPGLDGKTVLNGTTVPAAGLGNDGDFYIRTTTSDIYGPKTAGAWGSPTSLKGVEGSPWTAGGTLPAGATETGAWGTIATASGGVVSLPFALPLTAALDLSHVNSIKILAIGEGDLHSNTTVDNVTTTAASYAVGQLIYDTTTPANIPPGTTITACAPSCGAATSLTLSAPATATVAGDSLKTTGPTPAGCTGGTAADPKANPGFLCVYVGKIASGTKQFAGIPLNPVTQGEGAAKTGATYLFSTLAGEGDLVTGTYAVTG